MRTRYI